MSQPQEIRTFLCFNTSGAPCNSANAFLPTGAVTVPTIPGSYRMSYYSVDGDGNREPVKSSIINIQSSPYATLVSVGITQKP